jgi:hypothetical protein
MSFENQLLAAVAVTVVASLIVLRKAARTGGTRPECRELLLPGFVQHNGVGRGIGSPAAGGGSFSRAIRSSSASPAMGVLPANMAGVFRLQDVRGYDALTPRKYFDYMSAIDSSFPDLMARIIHRLLSPANRCRIAILSHDQSSAGDLHSRTT